MSKLIIFDLDDTLYLESGKLGDEVMWCIEYLKNCGHTLAIASHNINGEDILTRFDIIDYFDVVVCEYTTLSKMPLIKKILNITNRNLNDVVFFDDLDENIIDARVNGVFCVHVNIKTGVTCLDLHDAGL